MSVHVCLHFCCKILNKVVCCWTICHSGMEMESSGFGYAVFFLRQQMNCRVSGDLFISTKALFSQWLLLTCWPGAVEILLCRISVPQIAEQTHVHLLTCIKTSFSILFCFLTCSLRATVFVRGLSEMDQWIKPDSLFSPCQSVIYSERPVIGLERRLLYHLSGIISADTDDKRSWLEIG